MRDSGVKPADRASALGEALAHEAVPGDAETWEFSQIRAGIPTILNATQNVKVQAAAVALAQVQNEGPAPASTKTRQAADETELNLDVFPVEDAPGLEELLAEPDAGPGAAAE